MSDLIKHWAEYVKIGDYINCIIRHSIDGSKNIHSAKVFVLANDKIRRIVFVNYKGTNVEVPYNDINHDYTEGNFEGISAEDILDMHIYHAGGYYVNGKCGDASVFVKKMMPALYAACISAMNEYSSRCILNNNKHEKRI